MEFPAAGKRSMGDAPPGTHPEEHQHSQILLSQQTWNFLQFLSLHWRWQ
jgi:hypothetical protein